MLLHPPHYQFNSLLFGFLCCLHTEDKFTAVVEWFAISLYRFVLQALECKNNFCTTHCNLQIIRANFIRTSQGWTKNFVAHIFLLASALAYVALTLFSCITFSWCSIFKSDSLHKQVVDSLQKEWYVGRDWQWAARTALSSFASHKKIHEYFRELAVSWICWKQVCILNAEPRYCKGSMKNVHSLCLQVTSSNHK